MSDLKDNKISKKAFSEPYRANLDSRHEETTKEKVTRTEAQKGWDQPAPKMKWK